MQPQGGQHCPSHPGVMQGQSAVNQELRDSHVSVKNWGRIGREAYDLKKFKQSREMRWDLRNYQTLRLASFPCTIQEIQSITRWVLVVIAQDLYYNFLSILPSLVQKGDASNQLLYQWPFNTDSVIAFIMRWHIQSYILMLLFHTHIHILHFHRCVLLIFPF